MRGIRPLRVVLALVGATALLVTAGPAFAQYGGSGPLGLPSSVKPGESVALSASGFAANASVTVTIASTPVTLGTFNADARGNLNATVTIPSSIGTGTHTVTATGNGPSGAPVTVSQQVTVTSGGTIPVTGAQIAGLVVLGVVLVGAGSALSIARRRARAG